MCICIDFSLALVSYTSICIISKEEKETRVVYTRFSVKTVTNGYVGETGKHWRKNWQCISKL